MDEHDVKRILDSPPAALRKAVKNVAVGCCEAFRSARTFEFNGHDYHYFYHPYNLAWRNERSIEVPIARDFLLAHHGDEVLEVGNVLSHYGEEGHDVLDLYETADGVVNQDAADWKTDKRYGLIISISTLEHIGWDESPRRPEKVLQAVDNLIGLLAAGGEFVASAPLGYNPFLDSLIEQRRLPFDELYALERISRSNRWRQTEVDSVLGASYEPRAFRARAIFIGLIREGRVPQK